MKERLGPGVPAQDLERLVREAVAARLAGTAAGVPLEEGPAVAGMDGVCFVSGARLLEGGSGPVPVEGKVLVADAIRCGENYKLAGGYMDWQKASFSRTVEFPEIGVVLEGELQLTVGGKTLTAKPGDMVYFPKGAQVVYSAPARVRIACVNCIE
jgi:ethanolamine utilization protein EutQ